MALEIPLEFHHESHRPQHFLTFADEGAPDTKVRGGVSGADATNYQDDYENLFN